MKRFNIIQFIKKNMIKDEKRTVNEEVRSHTFTSLLFSLHYYNIILFYIYNIFNKENLFSYISLVLFFMIFKSFSNFFFKILGLIFFYPFLCIFVAVVSLFCINELSKRKHNSINFLFAALYSFTLSSLAIWFNYYGCSLLVEYLIYHTYILYYWKDLFLLQSTMIHPAVFGPYNTDMNSSNGNNRGNWNNRSNSSGSGNNGNGGSGGRNPLDPKYILLSQIHHNNWRPDEDYNEANRVGKYGYTYRDSPNNYDNYEEYGQRENKAWMHDVKPLLSHTYLHTPHLLSVSVRPDKPLRELISRDIDGIGNAMIRADRTIEELKQLRVNVAMLQSNMDNHETLSRNNEGSKLDDKDKKLINDNLGLLKGMIENEIRSREN